MQIVGFANPFQAVSQASAVRDVQDAFAMLEAAAVLTDDAGAFKDV